MPPVAPEPAPSLRGRAYVEALVLVLLGYFAMAKLGIALPVGEGVVTPVWAPTGIAIAALTLGGRRLWPAVFVAALLANATSGTSVLVASGIAVGNTLAPVVGAWLLRRAGFRPILDRVRDVGLLVAAGAASCVASATNGVAVLWIDGAIEPGALGSRWMLWWFGDLMGVLIAGSFIFAVAGTLRLRRRWSTREVVSYGLCGLATFGVTMLVFSGPQWRYPALLLPLWLLSTLRFRALGSTTTSLIIAVTSVGFTVSGTDVIAGADATQTVQILQGMLAIAGMCMLVVAAAISERDRANTAVTRALHDEQDVARRLREIDELKDSLLATVSHELRTPLTTILAITSLLKNQLGADDPAKRDEMYEHLGREARRLDMLLADLLDLERLRLGLLEPNYSRVDVPSLVQAVLERYAHLGRPTRVDLQEVELDADAAKLERIVDNLVGNAFKHTPPNGTVTVAVRSVDDGVVIAVDDEGAGVKDEDKTSIFDPFNRGTVAPADAPGTGVGLSLVARFATLHGGRAWVDDRDGGGSSFQVFLPAAHVVRD